jgi:hypothetical protein
MEFNNDIQVQKRLINTTIPDRTPSLNRRRMYMYKKKRVEILKRF